MALTQGHPQWTRHSNGYYEHAAEQMTPDWFAARKYRANGGSWRELLTRDTRDATVATMCSLHAITYDPADPSSYGIVREPDARAAYVAGLADLTTDQQTQSGDIPGLCIPDPFAPQWRWVPHNLRQYLVHVACSPDYRLADRIAEFKCPQAQVIYPNVLTTRRPLVRHEWQITANTGIMGVNQCDYFVWTPTETLRLAVPLDYTKFQDRLVSVLRVVKDRIAPVADASTFLLPTELTEWYWNWR